MKDKANCNYSEIEISEIIEENKRLSGQVKRLVKTEYNFYNTQIRLDNQIELYKALYSIGKKFTNITDIRILFCEMGMFILEQLNYGSYVIMERKNKYYNVIDKGGDFDKSSEDIKTEFELKSIKELFHKLKFNGENYARCDYTEFGKSLGMKNFVLFILDVKCNDNPEYLLFVGNPENDEFFSEINDNDMVIIGLCNLVSFVMNAMNNIHNYQELMKERESLERKVNERTKELSIALKELQRLNQKLQYTSLNDELTGLYNRRGFFTVGGEQFESAQKEGTPVLLIYCDLDGLKKINDTYGHKEGDFAIKQTAVLLKRVFRNTDIISRFGGDEYVVLLTNTPKDYIYNIEKRLKHIFENFNKNSGKNYKLSISIGYSSLSYEFNGMNSFEELIEKADKKLYFEKINKKSKP